MTKSTDDIAGLRKRFEASEEVVRAANYGRAAALALVFMLAGSSLDLIVMPEFLKPFFFIRAICAVLLGGVYMLLRRFNTGLGLRLMGHLVAGMPLASILWMIWYSHEAESTYYAGLNLVLVGASLLVRWPTLDSAINSGLCFFGYLAVALPMAQSQVGVFNNAYFLFVTAVFAGAGTYYYNELRFSEFCLRDEVVSSQLELAENHRKLQALDEAKTRFFANVSHELRTPLTLILGPLEQLRRMPAVSRDERSSSLVQMLEDNGLRLLRLINDLLDLVRLDGDAMPVRMTTVNISSFISGMGDSLRPTAELKQIRLRTNADCDEQQSGWIDRDRLEKIVLNLAINAIKFTPVGGTIDITARVNLHMLELQVQDTGHGIKAEELPYVFERFWQADMSAKRKHGGVGIGLALVRTLTESLGGTVSVTSVEGKGTTFLLSLPWQDVPIDATLADKPQDNGPDIVEQLHQRARFSGATVSHDPTTNQSGEEFGMAEAMGRMPKVRVLVADDEPGLRRYLISALDEYEVVEARDGKEALELARQYQPELAILDYMMPEIDGIELTRQLRSLNTTRRIPIVLVTANAENTSRHQALEAGVNDFITKPFSVVELTVRVRNLLKQQMFERNLADTLGNLEVAHRELKDNEVRLLQAERLSGLGRMSAGIIHEINNPLNYTTTALQVLKRYSRDIPKDEREDYVDTVNDAIEGVGRVVRIVSDLRAFTTGAPSAMQTLSLAKAVESARRFISSDLSALTLDILVPDDLIVQGNESQLAQVFTNMIQNAASFVMAAEKRGEKPIVKIAAQQSAGGSVTLTIWDNGCGIAPEDIGRVFDPFFTKRDVGQGMGLGLSICHQILKAHGVRVDVRSELNVYTEFSLCFPPCPSAIN